jgi:four helix bundle protein
MATINKFEDLEIFKLARSLHLQTHQMIVDGKFQNYFRFHDQITSAIASVMNNIAEGFERGSNKEFKLFLAYAKGSCGEFRAQLIQALDRAFINKTEYEQMNNEAQMIISKIQNFIMYLNKTELKGSRHLKE